MIDKKNSKYYKKIRPSEYAFEYLLAMIGQGNIQGGEMLPSERELSEELDVSRTTMRSVLKRLEAEEIIITIPGVGRKLNNKKLEIDLHDITSTSQLAEKAGYEVKTKLVSIDLLESSKYVASKLDIDYKDKVYRLIRSRSIGDLQTQFLISYLPAERFPGLELYDFEKNSLYEILKIDYETHLLQGYENLRLTKAEEFISEHLDIEENYPVFEVTGITFDLLDRPVDYFRNITKMDEIKYSSRLNYVYYDDVR